MWRWKTLILLCVAAAGCGEGRSPNEPTASAPRSSTGTIAVAFTAQSVAPELHWVPVAAAPTESSLLPQCLAGSGASACYAPARVSARDLTATPFGLVATVNGGSVRL